MSTSGREPVFNAPAIVMVLIGVFVLIHAARQALPELDAGFILPAFAFVPARYGEWAGQLPGEPWAPVMSFLTHMFLHGDWTHLGINSAWLLAMGTPIARRMPWTRFLLFTALCAIGGAVMFLVFNFGLKVPMVGASGAISGLMAATFRLVFAAGDFVGIHLLRDDPAHAPRLSIAGVFASRPAMMAITIWVVMNIVFAYVFGSANQGMDIAWEAHIGGFLVGLLAFGFFDRGPSLDGLPHLRA